MGKRHTAATKLRSGHPPPTPPILMGVFGNRRRKDSFRTRDIGERPRKQVAYKQGRGPSGRLGPDHKIRLHPLLANQ